MSNWAARMHRRAATFGNVVTSCGHPTGAFPRRLEKVKFGVPLEEVCKNDIPGPLLVSIIFTLTDIVAEFNITYGRVSNFNIWFDQTSLIHVTYFYV